MTLYRNPFENIVRKEENGGNQHFLLFPQSFLYFQKTNFDQLLIYIYFLSANAFNLDQYSILSFGKEITKWCTSQIRKPEVLGPIPK